MDELKNRVARYFTVEELAAFLELDVFSFVDYIEEELDAHREALMEEMDIDETDDEPEGSSGY